MLTTYDYFQSSDSPLQMNSRAPHGGAAHDGASTGGGVYTTFDEPARYLSIEDADARRLRGGEATRNACESIFPAWIVRTFYRSKNMFSVYSFFLIYCLNALLNLQIYIHYMESHSSSASSKGPDAIANQLYERSFLENLYIVTLTAPLIGVLFRVQARNYYKLTLAQSQTHAGITSSLAICTPSLNTYALLLLAGRGKWIAFIMGMDVLEIVYSAYMWAAQPVKTQALWIKLGFIAITTIIITVDLVILVQLRRFLFNSQGEERRRGERESDDASMLAALECVTDVCSSLLLSHSSFLDPDLPRHIHPIYVCWDVNHSFHWSSANSIFTLIESHEEFTDGEFFTPDAKRTRKRIQEWNEGEVHIEHVQEEAEKYRKEREGRQQAGRKLPHTQPPANNHQQDDSEAEDHSLLAARRR
jgi:hypothetical protein